ncbi:hypothetical protein V6Z77_010192 [Aspergillus fumigatus]
MGLHEEMTGKAGTGFSRGRAGLRARETARVTKSPRPNSRQALPNFLSGLGWLHPSLLSRQGRWFYVQESEESLRPSWWRCRLRRPLLPLSQAASPDWWR